MNKHHFNLPWDQIEIILLDMDGTLLDLNFDNHFWQEFVPIHYAKRHGLSLQQAKSDLQPKFDALKGTLEWYCLDFWSRELQLDLRSLKREIAGLISVFPHVIPFLEAARQSHKKLWLVTNAHPDVLNLKMENTCLNRFFDRIICSHHFGYPKENVKFWHRLSEKVPFPAKKALFIDDSLAVLEAGKAYGIRYNVAISRPDSKQPPRIINQFPSVVDLKQLLPQG